MEIRASFWLCGRGGGAGRGGLVRLPLQTVSMAALAKDALALAVQYGSSAYDAAYVALAQRTALPLVTANEALVRGALVRGALVRRFDATGLDARFLGD